MNLCSFLCLTLVRFAAGYSEDSDYTSDLNYPVGQHANSSASQFRSAADQMHTPQRSLETSRENSYERDDAPSHQHHLAMAAVNQHHLSPGPQRRHQSVSFTTILCEALGARWLARSVRALTSSLCD